ncbi:MAG: ABC transporter permease [Methanomassiliicoccales archaeon]|jgi:ABC-2 type transport system permease protein|nr:ABC transporter permease [Methanomassiliicoccales archaeon]
MRGFLNITKKEIRELLTPATIVPIIVMAVIFGSLGNMIGSVGEEASKPPIIGVIDLDKTPVSEIAVSSLTKLAEVVYNDSNINEGIRTVEEKGGTALIIFPDNFSENILNNRSGEIQIIWIMRGSGVLDSIPSGVVEALIQQMNFAIAEHLIGNESKVNPKTILNPTVKNETTMFKNRQLTGVSPTTIMGILSQQSFVIPLVVVLVIVISGGTVISSMGSEKENKTLETLLTLPVKRSSIVFGKLVGAAIVGLIMAVIYMIGFGYYISSIQQQSPVDLATYGFELGLFDYLLTGITLFLSLFAALALCMLLGIFAKNMKSAQTLTMPITFLAIIPMFILIFGDFDTLPFVVQIILFAIPFSHPMLAMQNLMLDNYTFVAAGIVYQALFGLLTVYIAVWLFKKDILITGKSKGEGEKLSINLIWRLVQLKRSKE